MTAALSTAEQLLRFPWTSPPSPGDAIEVARGILWLRMPLPFALDHINLWLMLDGDGWTQLDCGYGDAPTRLLWEHHFASTLRGRPLARVIATHFHPDHLGNAAWLAQRFACPLSMPQAEYLTAHAVAHEHSGYGTIATCELFRAHGLAGEYIDQLAQRGNSYRRGVPDLPVAYRRLLAGDEFAVGAHRWSVIAGYGHSPEHASLYCADVGIFISGDMLLPKISTNVSVWPPEPDGDPLARFLASLGSYADLPSQTLVLPSHGLPFVGIATRVRQLREHHAARLAELERAASRPVTAADIVPVLFPRALDIQQRLFAMGEAIAHLNHLWHAGRLVREGTNGTIRFRRA